MFAFPSLSSAFLHENSNWDSGLSVASAKANKHGNRRQTTLTNVIMNGTEHIFLCLYFVNWMSKSTHFLPSKFLKIDL